MTKQSDIFLQGEGRKWWERNKDKIDVANDPILKMIKESDIKPKRVLEIGCANGWRLRELAETYGCEVHGIDTYGQGESDIRLDFGTADDLATCFDDDYDLVIYGFCLYLCDREDLFRIAMEGDRVLADKGHLIIWDFMPAYPHRRPYSHKTGVFAYKMNHVNLWRSNPAYSLVKEKISINGLDRDDTTAVTLLKKDMEEAWPQRSY